MVKARSVCSKVFAHSSGLMMFNCDDHLDEVGKVFCCYIGDSLNLCFVYSFLVYSELFSDYSLFLTN